MKKFLIVIVTAAILTACSTGESAFPARQLNVNISNVITPVKIADYDTDLSKKIEGTAEGYLSKNTNLDYYKEQAMVRACVAANVDFLINPIFTATTKGTKVTVKVNGYPAKYAEIRNATPADSIHFKYSGGMYQAPVIPKSRLKMIY